MVIFWLSYNVIVEPNYDDIQQVTDLAAATPKSQLPLLMTVMIIHQQWKYNLIHKFMDNYVFSDYFIFSQICHQSLHTLHWTAGSIYLWNMLTCIFHVCSTSVAHRTFFVVFNGETGDILRTLLIYRCTNSETLWKGRS